MKKISLFTFLFAFYTSLMALANTTDPRSSAPVSSADVQLQCQNGQPTGRILSLTFDAQLPIEDGTIQPSTVLKTHARLENNSIKVYNDKKTGVLIAKLDPEQMQGACKDGSDSDVIENIHLSQKTKLMAFDMGLKRTSDRCVVEEKFFNFFGPLSPIGNNGCIGEIQYVFDDGTNVARLKANY